MGFDRPTDPYLPPEHRDSQKTFFSKGFPVKKASSIILIVLRIMVVVCDGLCILLAFFHYETIKKFGDFLSPDKNFKSLTPSLVASLRNPSLILGILIFLMGMFVFFWSRKARDIIGVFLQFLLDFYRRFIKDSRVFFRDTWLARPGRAETLILAVTVIFSAIARVMLINRPIEYDEAYTFVEFARHPFRYIISNYYVPNNQVLNSILVRLSTLLFGDHLWQIRLPTLIASLFLVLCVFFLGRSLYDSKVGLTAAVVVAFLPTVIIRSVSARGYIIVTLMTLLGFIAADYVIRKKNLFAWFFLIITCALGFYTIPMMVFPCGMVFVWLLLAGITKEIGKEYPSLSNWLKYLVVAGFSILILTVILYSPILFTNNLRQIYAYNRVLQPASLKEFIASFPATVHALLMEWVNGIAGPIAGVLLAGLLLSFVFHKKNSVYRIPMQLIFFVYIGIMLLIERPYPITRIWLWVLPLFAIWCAAGIAGGLQWASQKVSVRYITPLVLAIMLIGFAANGMYQSYGMSVLHPSAEDPAAEKVTVFLKPLLTQDDLVVVSSCSNARYWYYFEIYGIPENVIRNRNRFFTKMYIIVYTKANPSCGDEEMATVLSGNGPDAVFFDLSTVRILKQIDYATIYELDPIHERIEKAYPNH